jgi:hypothetical protein
MGGVRRFAVMFDLVFLIVLITAIAWMLVGGVFTVLSFLAFDRLLRRVWVVSTEGAGAS